MRAVHSVWREERRARWFLAAHLQGTLVAGAGYIPLILLAGLAHVPRGSHTQ